MSDSKNRLLNPYSESVKGFKNKNFYVVPTNRSTKENVCNYSKVDMIESAKFPSDWTSDHFEVPSGLYSVEVNLLEVDDLEA